MIGSCQSSKFHYKVQCFLIPKYLPKFVWRSNYGEGLSCYMLYPYKNFTGKWRCWNESGNLCYEGDKLNGENNGKEVYFEEIGREFIEANYEKGINIGVSTTWFNSDLGIKHYELEYDKNGAIVKSTLWNKNGIKVKTENYIENKLDDEAVEWYENGSKKSVTNYIKGWQISINEWNDDGSEKNKE